MQEAHGAPHLRPIAPELTRGSALVVVCRQCSKRSSGPRKLKSKHLARTLREAMPRAARRARVVLSSCMGLCPKRGIAVAVTGTSENGAFWSIGSLDEGRQLVGQWLVPAATTVDPISPLTACAP